MARICPNYLSGVGRKSSYSEGGANDCVEVADGYPGIVPVRDSKSPAGRPLLISAASWSVFVEQVKGEARLTPSREA
ncbi:DUF397 domain-containing protein [Streptomyces sp. NPDC096040]|uniref:DUF397 domain-containing protein n=1 Tax=Streptomyces sp. NPDC096040 TaxID=3155541 RepID=UPI00332E5E0B